MKKGKLDSTDPLSWAWRQKETMIGILWRDEFTCQLCGSHRHLQVHHVQSRSRGGSNDKSNLLTVCRECHGDIHENRIALRSNLPCTPAVISRLNRKPDRTARKINPQDIAFRTC